MLKIIEELSKYSANDVPKFWLILIPILSTVINVHMTKGNLVQVLYHQVCIIPFVLYGWISSHNNILLILQIISFILGDIYLYLYYCETIKEDDIKNENK